MMNEEESTNIVKLPEEVGGFGDNGLVPSCEGEREELHCANACIICSLRDSLVDRF